MHSPVIALHHIGIVTSDSLEKSLAFYQSLGFSQHKHVEGMVRDGLHRVTVAALTLKESTVELLDPLDEQSPVFEFKRRGGGLHHQCFQVDTLENGLSYFINTHNMRQITKPTQSVWNKKEVVFLLKKKEIIELIAL